MKPSNLFDMLGIIILVSLSGEISAETDIKTTTTSCRNEAVSTGLEDEADIKAYVDLCMQGWQNPADYTDSYSIPEDVNEPPTAAPQSMPR